MKILYKLLLLCVLAVVIAFVHYVVFDTSGFLHIIGINPTPGGTSPWYQLWSGFVPAIAILAPVAALFGWYLNHTCHDHTTCLRWGKYPAAGGLFKLCRHHHPDMKGQKPDREMIHRLHREHLDRISR